MVKDYLKLGVLNKNIGKLGVFIVERERDIIWNEEVTLTLMLRNYSDITIKELIIEDFWNEWGTLVKDKIKANNEVITIGENDKLTLNKLNQQEICIIEFKFKVKEKAPRYIKQKVKTQFKYIHETLDKPYHIVEGDYFRFKIYEKLIKNVEIKKEIIVESKMQSICTPLNYDVKFDINNIQSNGLNNRGRLTSKIEGNIFINLYYKNDDGKFDNLKDKISFYVKVDDVKLEMEQIYISTEKLLIKIIDINKILTTISFNIYKTNY